MSVVWVVALALTCYGIGRLHEGCRPGGTLDLENDVRHLGTRLRIAREQAAQGWAAAHEANGDAVLARTAAGTAWTQHQGLRVVRPVHEMDSNVVELRRAVRRGSAS